MLAAKNSIQFGIFEKTGVSVGSGSICSAFSINSREYMATTTKELVKFETKEIKKRLKYQFLAAIRIPNTEFIIGVTTVNSELVVLQLSDIYRPLLEHFKTGQQGIFHLLYSPKSQTLITIGTGVKTWKLQYRISDKFTSVIRSEIIITPRANFAAFYETSILSCPAIDQEQERIFLPEESGMVAYDFDGKCTGQATCVPATVSTCCCYNAETKKLMTYDTSEGMCLWSASGRRLKQLAVANASVFAMYFVDNENVVCYNAKRNLYYVNIKTERTFQCYETDEKPNRMTIVRDRQSPEIIYSSGMKLKVLKLVIPWHVWRLNIPCAAKMERCNKFCEAGRVLIQTSTAYIQLFSPVNGRMMTMATPSSPVRPVDCFYDRGIIIYHRRSKNYVGYEPEVVQIHPGQKRDELFLALQDGTFCAFQTDASPCPEIHSVEAKARYLTFVKYQGEWCYAYSSDHGDLYILNYETFEVLKHVIVSSDKLLGVMYHNETEQLLMFFEGLTMLYNIDNDAIVCSLRMKTPCSRGMFGDFIKFGYETGHIGHIDITKESLIIDNPDCLRKPHNAAVSGFSFSPEVWISSSMDGVVLVWDYNDFNTHKIILPLPLYSCLLLNGRRDILVATETEVMKINGSTVFDREFDDERTEIDNFDRLKDALDTSGQDQQEEEEYMDEEESEGFGNYVWKSANNSRRPSLDMKDTGDVKSFVESMKKMPIKKATAEPPVVKSEPQAKVEKEQDPQDQAEREQARKKILEEMLRINESESVAPPPPRRDYVKKTEPPVVKNDDNGPGDKTKQADDNDISMPKQVKKTEAPKKRPKKHKKATEPHEVCQSQVKPPEAKLEAKPEEKPKEKPPENNDNKKDDPPKLESPAEPQKAKEAEPEKGISDSDHEKEEPVRVEKPKKSAPPDHDSGDHVAHRKKKSSHPKTPKSGKRAKVLEPSQPTKTIPKVKAPTVSKKRTKMKDFAISLNHTAPIADTRVQTELNFQIGEAWHGEIQHLPAIRDIRPRAKTVRARRWGYVKVRGLNWKRARTPPPRTIKRTFSMPSPNILLDYNAIIELVRQGHTEYEPLLRLANIKQDPSKWSRYASLYAPSPRAKMAQTYQKLHFPLEFQSLPGQQANPNTLWPKLHGAKVRLSKTMSHVTVPRLPSPYQDEDPEDSSVPDSSVESTVVRQTRSVSFMPKLHELEYAKPIPEKPQKPRIHQHFSMSTGGLKFDMSYMDYVLERQKELENARPLTAVPPLEIPDLEPQTLPPTEPEQEPSPHPIHEPRPRRYAQSARRCDRGTQPDKIVHLSTSTQRADDPLATAVLAKLPIRRECASVRKSRPGPLIMTRFKTAVRQPQSARSMQLDGSVGVRNLSARSNR